MTVKSSDPKQVGRAFSNSVVEMALASYPGFFATSPPGEANPYGVYWPALVPAEVVTPAVVLADGTRRDTPWTESTERAGDVVPPKVDLPPAPAGTTKRLPLGTVFGARSGDKGGNANVGVWARSAAGYAWLNEFLSVEKLKQLMPETADLEVRRFEFANLWGAEFRGGRSIGRRRLEFRSLRRAGQGLGRVPTFAAGRPARDVIGRRTGAGVGEEPSVRKADRRYLAICQGGFSRDRNAAMP